MGSRALLRFSSDKQQSECVVIIFSRHCHVEKDDCRRCSSKRDVAHFRLLFGWKSVRCKTQSCTIFLRWEKNQWSRPDTTAVGQSSVAAKQTGFVDSRDCVQFQTGQSPLRIPPKSWRYLALSHTYCSVAYLQKSPNIRALLQRSPYLPLLWASWNSPSVYFPSVSFHGSSALFSSPTLFSNV